jgi:hypothetical protein
LPKNNYSRMRLEQILMEQGLQKTLILVNQPTQIIILKYIGTWLKNCRELIKISTQIFDITQGKRVGNFWETSNKIKMTYGEVFTKMLDLDEDLSQVYKSDWIFNNIMCKTEKGNWSLQNKLIKEFTGARHLEFSSEKAKMNHFFKGQRKLKWMIIHVTRFIETGKIILNS